MLALVAAMAFVAGLVQGVTGFGAGIVLMVVLPSLFSVVQAAGISQATCVVLIVAMLWRYRASVSWGKVAAPVLLFLAASWSSMLLAKSVDQNLMKLILGIFLVALAVYSLGFQRSDSGELSLPVSLFCIVFSGVCDGMFGIGGPLMVVYYLSKTGSKEEYLGTLQAFFGICTGASFVFRLVQGLLPVSALPVIGLGAVFVISGLAVANRVVVRLDAAMVRKLTYVVIGLAGLYNAGVSALALAQ